MYTPLSSLSLLSLPLLASLTTAADSELLPGQRQTWLKPTDDCALLGPAFASDFDLSQSQSIKDAIAAFPASFDKLVAAGQIDGTNSSYAIDVFSTYTNKTIYSFFHNGDDIKKYATKGVVDDHTQFRIGSVSKLFTTYALLAKAGLKVLNDPVTKYLPELAGNSRNDPLNKIIWEDITVEALAAQLAGTGEFPPSELAFLDQTGNATLNTCTTEAFLKNIKNKIPTAPVFDHALYSDAGFGVLGRVLERVAGKQYNDALHDILVGPLALESSTSYKPNGTDYNAVALPGPVANSAWGFDNQNTAPSGGVYANAHDLRAVGLSILHSTLLPRADTRRWLKPRSASASLTLSLGAPWEIYRLTLPATPGSSRTRVSDLYTKAGGQSGYGTVLALSPDHGLGFSINAASVPATPALAARFILRDAVGELFLPAAEAAGYDNAKQHYAGTFVSADGKSNATLGVDPDRPALGVQSMFLNGTDYKTALGLARPETISVRLYPSQLETNIVSSSSSAASAAAKQLAYRAVISRLGGGTSTRASVEGGTGLFDDACIAFLSVDESTLDGTYGADEFVLEVVDGRVEKVIYRSGGVVLSRVE